MVRKRSRQSSLVVASQVRRIVRAHKCLAAGDLIAGLDACVGRLLERAVRRAKHNERKTVRSYDL